LSLQPTGNKTSAPLDLIFSDVWGPAPMFSSNGFRYFVIFINVHIKYIWYYPFFAKSDVFSIFQRFQLLVEHWFSQKIKFVQTFWGDECCYPNFDPCFDNFFKIKINKIK
jgi:histone deacetylase 1/2